MKKIIGTVISIILMVIWAVMLLRSDSFPFVYILMAVSGVVSLFLTEGILRKRPDKARKPHRVSVIIMGVILSACVVLANYGLPGALFKNKALVLAAFAVMFAGGFVTFANIQRFLIIRAEEPVLREKIHRFRPGCIFVFSAAVLIAVYSLVLLLGFYPGIISPDSVNQIEQTFTGVYSNHHPFWHTMIIRICLRAGTALFGDINAGVCLYSIVQIICMGCSFAYIIMTLYQMKISYRLLIPVLVYFAVMPYHVIYSFTMWKDVLFGAAMAVFITALYRIMAGIPDTGKTTASNMVLLAVSALGTCLFRSNGQIAFIVAFIAAIFVLGRKYLKVLVLLAAVLIISIIMKYPVLSALHVTQPDTIESLSIPAQQIARIIADGGRLTDEQTALLENIVDVDRVAQTYQWYTSDYIKDLVREKDNQEYISEHRMDLIKLYLQLGVQHPSGFVKGWIDATKGYFNGGYGLFSWLIVNENNRGISMNSASKWLYDAAGDYSYAYNKVFILQPFVSIGLCVWIICMTFTACAVSRRKAALLAVPCIAMILTLLIATPIYAEFRYAYALYTCIPVILCAGFHRKYI